MAYIKTNDIIIPDSFTKTYPKERKVKECKDIWDKYHMQDRYIILDNHNVLVNGYVMYLVLKMYDVENAFIKRVVNSKYYKGQNRINPALIHDSYKNTRTCYIHGIHDNEKIKKERIWRMEDEDDWNKVNVGDNLIAKTKHGDSKIIITRKTIASVCPVNMDIRKCYRIKD